MSLLAGILAPALVTPTRAMPALGGPVPAAAASMPAAAAPTPGGAVAGAALRGAQSTSAPAVSGHLPAATVSRRSGAGAAADVRTLQCSPAPAPGETQATAAAPLPAGATAAADPGWRVPQCTLVPAPSEAQPAAAGGAALLPLPPHPHAAALREAAASGPASIPAEPMVRGGVRKTELEEINDLFRLTAPDWVSTPESEARRRMIADNEWFKGPLSAGTKSQYQTALRKWLSYAAMQARQDLSFTSLQDSDNKVYAFLNWLLDEIEAHNANADQKARLAPAQQLEHALQALSCVKKCQAGVPGQKEGWSGNDSILKGAMTRARTMQAALQASAARSSGLNAKMLTASQYNAYLDEAWTFGASPEAAQTGMFMVVQATIATTCGLRAEDSAELRWPLMAGAEPVEGVGPAQLVPITLGLRRAQSKVSCAGIPEWFALVENKLPEHCPILAVACLLIQTQPNYQQAFLEDDDRFWEHRLLAQGVHNLQRVPYYQLHSQHSKVMTSIGLAEDKEGTALHIFRSTGNAMLGRQGATKSQIDAWGRWDQSVQHVSYAAKDPLHNLPLLALLGGWGADYAKEFFLGRSSVQLEPDLFNEFVALLRPTLAATEAEVAARLEALNSLPRAERRSARNATTRTLLTDMQNSVGAEKRLIAVFLCGLPLLVDRYGDQLVVVRGSAAGGRLLRDERLMDFCERVRHAHQLAQQRLEHARLPMEERMAAMLARMQTASVATIPAAAPVTAPAVAAPALTPTQGVPETIQAAKRRAGLRQQAQDRTRSLRGVA